MGACLLGATLLVAGCGDDGDGGDDGSATDADQPDETAGACGLLTVDEVSELFGHQAAVTPVEGAPRPSTSCSWTAGSDDGEPTSWQLQLQAYEGSEFFDPNVWGDNPQPIDDLGDEAFVVDGGDLRGVTAAYREGEKSVLLGYTIVLGEDTPDPSAQQDEVVELLRKVHERF